MRRKKFWNQNGHTLIEMLITVLVLVSIIALLLPMFSKGQRNAYGTVCISYLKQMSMAHQIVMTESKVDDALAFEMKGAATHWPGLIYPRLDEEILFCPESEFPFGTTSLNQLMIAVHENGNGDKTGNMTEADLNKVTFYMELDESRPWVKKLGWEQYQAYRTFLETEVGKTMEQLANQTSANNTQIDKIINYWKTSYHGYEPGEDPDHFVMFAEDYKIVTHTNNKAYQNFVDFVVIVEPVEGNDRQVEVSAQHFFRASPDAGYLVWSDSKEPIYTPVDAMRVNDSRSIVIDKDLGSYGANPKQIFSQNMDENRILFMDYQHVIAGSGNWDKWDDAYGVPEYARHAQDTMNVSFVDGSVSIFREEQIEPTLFSNEKVYW